MDTIAIIEKLKDLGVRVSAAGERLRLEPGSRVPPELVEEVKAHKRELMAWLGGCRLKYPDVQTSPGELAEIEAEITNEGFVLLWSNVLQDTVAFYKSEAGLKRVPPGFVPYSEQELWELFAEGRTVPSPAGLRLIHEAKKRGGRITNREKEQRHD